MCGCVWPCVAVVERSLPVPVASTPPPLALCCSRLTPSPSPLSALHPSITTALGVHLPPLQRTVANLIDRERLGLRQVAGCVKGLLLSMLLWSERGRLFDFRIERVGRRSVSRGAARPPRSPSFRCHSRSPGHTHRLSAHPPSPLPPLLTSDPTSKKKCTLEALSMK